MRIGIDCRTILNPDKGEKAGVGHYTHHLVTSLLAEDAVNDYVLFFDDHAAAQAKREHARGNPRVTVRVLPFLSFKRNMPFVYAHMVVSAVFARERLDVLHGPANVTPLFYRGRTVVTVHDLAIYDHPEWFPRALPGARTFSTRILVPYSIRRAERVIAVSRRTKDEIVRIMGVDGRKIDVVHEGAAPPGPGHDCAVRADLPHKRYFLFLGTVEPRKNVATAVRAFVHCVRRGWVPDDVSLVIAGARGWKDGPVFDEIAAANAAVGDRVRYVGYLREEEKHCAVAGALAFVFPSYDEGFGLPVVEAMAAGTPVICSSVSALLEIAGDACLTADPSDTEGFAHAMRAVSADPDLRARLAAAGRQRSADFTWERTARATIASYGRAMSA